MKTKRKAKPISKKRSTRISRSDVKRKNSKKQSAKVRTRKVGTRRRLIDARFKTLVIASEPPINRRLDDLDSTFRDKLLEVLDVLKSQGKPFKFVEGFRTVDRQQWLYGSGRPTAKYGRSGPILTYKDGVTKLSNHQGNSSPGSGRAADCYPMKNGKVYIPNSNDPIWEDYAQAAESSGLRAGHHWKTFKDSPHCELKAG
jgi:hypothetical protein